MQAGSTFIRFNSAGDVTVKAGHTLGPRSIDDYELVYFPAGTETQYVLEGRAQPLNSPSIILTRPDESHVYRFDARKPTRHLFVHFYPQSDALFQRFPSLQGRSSASAAAIPSHSLIPVLMRQLLSDEPLLCASPFGRHLAGHQIYPSFHRFSVLRIRLHWQRMKENDLTRRAAL